MPGQVLKVTAPCPGSGVSFSSDSKAILCYCARRFNLRFNNRKPTWQIPPHNITREVSLTCGSDSKSELLPDSPNITSSDMTNI